MSDEFPPREMVPNNGSGIYYLQTYKYFQGTISEYSMLNTILSHELINCPIIGVYMRNKFIATVDDALFKCLICDTAWNCFSAVGSLYDHIYVYHCCEGREISRTCPISWESMKWYWACVNFSKNEKYRYHIAEGVSQDKWNNDNYEDMSIRMLSDSDIFCLFCGNNYGGLPAKEVILTHLVQCKSLPSRVKALVYECAG